MFFFIIFIYLLITTFYLLVYSPGQFAAGVYPLASASARDENQILFSSFIRLAPEHQEK